jgi:hypothetical protein
MSPARAREAAAFIRLAPRARRIPRRVRQKRVANRRSDAREARLNGAPTRALLTKE